MEKTIRKLAGEIKANRAPEVNLPELMNRMASAYGLLSLYNLDMELSMFEESKTDGRIIPDKAAKELKAALYGIMGATLQAPFDPAAYENAVKELAGLRDKVTARMDILTAYTDLFILYEYIINRLEAVFEPRERIPLDNDTAAREILQWIFETEDSAVVNGRIREMLSCLPVRMTKAKFLEHVENAFSIYEDADNRSVDTFDYMLRSAAGLYSPKGMAKTYPKLDKVKRLFEEKPLTELTAEEYRERREALKVGTEYILNATECLSAIQASANALMTVLLTRQYFTLAAEKQSQRPLDILHSLLSGTEVRAEVLFEGIEAEMEQLMADVTSLEPLLVFVKENLERQVEELMLSVVYQRLLVVQRLNSGSAYASLTEDVPENTEGYTEKRKKAFLADVQKVLENGSRVRNRAVMAEVLKELPVYFHNHTEVMNYVRNSLESCRDEREKQICVELLRSCYD